MAKRNYYDLYGQKTLNMWLNDKKRPKGCTPLNMEYIRDLKQYEREFSRIIIITYFLLTDRSMGDVRQMFLSAKKQKEFIYAVKYDLKRYVVTDEWQKVFQRDFQKLRNRLDHVFRIIQENIRLTDMYPYFQDVGFDRLIDFSIEYPKDNDACKNQLLSEISDWNAKHPDEVEAHMQKVQPEIEIRDRHRAEVRETERIEKEIRKAARKAENAEIREMKQNEHKHQVQNRKTERMFDYLYK